MGPFNCANWYHSRVIPRESGAPAAAGPASNLSAQPHGDPRGRNLACALRPPPKSKTHWVSPHHSPTRPGSTGLGFLHRRTEGPHGAGGGGRPKAARTREHPPQERAHRRTRPATRGCPSDVATLLSSLLSPVMASRPQRCSWLSSAAAGGCLLPPGPPRHPFLCLFQFSSRSTLLWGTRPLAYGSSPVGRVHRPFLIISLPCAHVPSELTLNPRRGQKPQP